MPLWHGDGRQSGVASDSDTAPDGAPSTQTATSQAAPRTDTGLDERSLIASLRSGDEAVFMRLVEQYQAALVRLALVYVRDPAVAEEVAQETWLSVLKNLNQFEGRSSFKTWLFHILVNGAKSRSQRERRSVPFSALAEPDDESTDSQPSVPPERFRPEGDPYAGGWATIPQRWDQVPEANVASRETLDRIMAAIARLPVTQQSVIRLRDVEGYASEDVCQILGVSEANQRVLLHRARSRVRQALEAYFTED
ncbi:MAG TPA: sigma-70 family RNA polymerase sigma factor [Ktedonobacterales bacterium]|nr:sigma-70 family RNA polymerase sigma factor [Ktedonobacterales bacterium]